MPARNDAALSIVKQFVDLDPVQAALALEGLPPDQAAVVAGGLPPSSAVKCLERVNPSFAAAVLESLAPEKRGEVLARMAPDPVAHVFRSLSETARAAAVESLSPELRKQVQEILSYPEDSAGRIMSTDVVAFHKDQKVREVIARLRSMGAQRASSYAYVVGPENKLIGVLNMRDLILAETDAVVEKIMRTDVFAVEAFADREEVIHQAADRHFLSIPVVDAQRRLLGSIRSEDLLESTHEEATEDIQRLFGASGEERVFSPLRFKVRQRLPWLNINLLTAFLAAAVVAHYEAIIGRIAVLAVFLPVVAGQGGNAGVQTLSVVLRGLVMREVRPNDNAAIRVILSEVSVGLINGAAIGAVTAAAAWLWRGNPYLGLVVGLAMVVNMLAAALAGAAIPIAMKKLGFDPAQSSGIFVTTVTDVVGFLAFLGFATMLEGRLI